MTKHLTFLLFAGILASCTVKEMPTGELKTLHSPSQSSSGEPFLFTDKKDNTYLSWVEKGETESTLKYSMLHGDEWSNPIVIATGSKWFVNWADYPMMATDGNGFIAHFLEKSGDGTYAYNVKVTSSSDQGRTWNEATILHDDGKLAEHGFVSMVPYQENFFVSWLDGRNTAMEGMEHHEGHQGEMTLRAAILDSEGKKIKEWELDKRVCDCCQTSAAITDNGPVVIYRDRSDEEIRDMSIVRLVDGQWTEPKSIHLDNWKIEGCPVNGPRISSLGNNLAIVWFSMPEGKAQVNVVFSSDGGATLDKAIRIGEGNTIGRVDIEMLDDKSAMVSWMEGTVIKAVKVNADGTKGTPILIASSSDSRASGFPQMTKSKDRLIFAWTDSKDKIIKTATFSL